MTGLFRSLTLRSARHSLAWRKGRQISGRQETHSYLVDLSCLSSSFFILLAESLCLVQHLWGDIHQQGFGGWKKILQVPARFQDRLIDLKKVSQEKSGVNHQEIIRYPLKFSEILYGIIYIIWVCHICLSKFKWQHPVVLLVVFKLNTPIRGCISSNSGLGPYQIRDVFLVVSCWPWAVTSCLLSLMNTSSVRASPLSILTWKIEQQTIFVLNSICMIY
jgi:hypothetical protein